VNAISAEEGASCEHLGESSISAGAGVTLV
jgi:hypothetical protein